MPRKRNEPEFSYDPACQELAEHFLWKDKLDNEHNRKTLAQAIQTAVEDWFNQHEKNT